MRTERTVPSLPVSEDATGESRRTTPGNALLLEGAVEKRHASRVVGSGPARLFAVRLQEGAA